MDIEILGAYLPRLDKEGLSRYCTEYKEEMIRDWKVTRAEGLRHETDEEIEYYCENSDGDAREALMQAAIFEARVRGNNTIFESTSFEVLPSTDVSWAPKYFALGEDSVVCNSDDAPANLEDFRVVFYILEWDGCGKLVGPTGELVVPDFRPVPKRIWEIAPYEVFS